MMKMIIVVAAVVVCNRSFVVVAVCECDILAFQDPTSKYFKYRFAIRSAVVLLEDIIGKRPHINGSYYCISRICLYLNPTKRIRHG